MRILLAMLVILSGCAYSISNVDITNTESNCARECSKVYSQCVSGGPSVGFKTETLRACGEAYQICIKTCPTK